MVEQNRGSKENCKNKNVILGIQREKVEFHNQCNNKAVRESLDTVTRNQGIQRNLT